MRVSSLIILLSLQLEVSLLELLILILQHLLVQLAAESSTAIAPLIQSLQLFVHFLLPNRDHPVIHLVG